MNLAEKVALITGGASGIGLGIAKEFLKNNIKGIVIVDIQPKGYEITKELKNEYGDNKVIFAKADVSVKSELKSAFETAIDSFGNLDIVFNNAGIANERDPERCYMVNLIGASNCIKLAMDEFLYKYKSSNEGIIINTSSLTALEPDNWHTIPAYVASKCALIGLTKTLSHDFHYVRTGVKIMSICPGVTLTPIFEKLETEYEDESAEAIQGYPSQKVEDLAKHIIPILHEGKNGSIWKLEDKKREEIGMSTFTIKNYKNYIN